MYNNERVVIDTRKYDIDEILLRYKQGKIIFYEKKVLHGSGGKELFKM